MPAASKSGKAGSSKLTALQAKIHKVGLAAPNQMTTQAELVALGGFTVGPALQDSINVLLRLSLITMFQDLKGSGVMFKFSSREDATNAGAMESDEKLVYDQIKNSGNTGIWTKTIKGDTGLHHTSMNRVLKSLESKKQIKVVKSVKYPTRKIYMLIGITPSDEMTGGPWFTDNELDSSFIQALRDFIERCLQNSSIPDSKFRTLYNVGATPYLPTVREINRLINESQLSAVTLTDLEVSALLDVMIYDGMVEKIFVPQAKRVAPALVKGKPNKKIKRDVDESDDEDEDSDEDQKSPTVKKGVKKGSDDSEEQSDEDGDDSDDEVMANLDNNSSSSEDEGARKKGKGKGKTAGKGNGGGVATENSTHVYRLIKPYKPVLGWTDMPCGNCPSESFCAEPTRPLGPHHAGPSLYKDNGMAKKNGAGGPMKGIGMIGGVGAAIGVSNDKWGKSRTISGGVAPVNPRDCHYFKNWLDFSAEDEGEEAGDAKGAVAV